MATYNTGNPVPSAHPFDLYDNSQNLDIALNGTASDTWPDRKGVTRKSWAGIEADGARGNYVVRTIEQLNLITPPDDMEAGGRVTEGPGAGYYIYENGAWEETDDPLKNEGVNPCFVPFVRNGAVSEVPSAFMDFVNDITVHQANPEKDYQIQLFLNKADLFPPAAPIDSFQIVEFDKDTFNNQRLVVGRIQEVSIDRDLEKQSIHIESYNTPGLAFSMIVSPKKLPPEGTALRTSFEGDPGYSWKISPTCLQYSFKELEQRVDDIENRIDGIDSSTFDRLKLALADPLYSVRSKFIGDSITWGIGVSDIAPTAPSEHQLSDARNNYTSLTWVNLFRDFLGKTYLPNATIAQEDTEFHQTPDFSGYAYYEKTLQIDVTGVDKVQFINRETGAEIAKSSLTRESRPNAIWGYSIPVGLVRNSNAYVKFPLVGDNVTVVYTSTSPTSEPDSIARLINDETGETVGEFNYFSSGVGNQKRYTFTFPWGKYKFRIENLSQNNRNLEVEALEHNKKICVNNDGLSGTAATEWALRIADQSLDVNDDFVFIQLGTNDRGLTPSSVTGISADSGLRQFKDAMDIIISKVQSITGNMPVLMCANAVTGTDPTAGFSMSELNGAIRKLAHKHGTTFVDQFTVTSQLKLDNVDFTDNAGLHPIEVGHRVMYGNLVQTIFGVRVPLDSLGEYKRQAIEKYGLVPLMVFDGKNPLSPVRYNRTIVAGRRMRFTPITSQTTQGYASIDLGDLKFDPAGKIIRYRLRAYTGTGNRGYVAAARGDISNNNNTYGAGALPADESAWRAYEVKLTKRGNGSDWISGDKVYQILVPFSTPSTSNAVYEIDWLVVGEQIVVDENISV